MVGHLELYRVLVAQRSKATPGSSDIYKIPGWKMLADVVVHPEPIPSVLVLGLLNPGELVQPSRAFCSTSLGISTFLSSGSVEFFLCLRF